MKAIRLLMLALLLVSGSVSAADEPVTRTLVWPDGTRYVGGVLDGKRHGKGTIFWQDGTRFVGEFMADLRNGPGTMILPDGTVYNGFFKDDDLIDSPTIDQGSATLSVVEVAEDTPVPEPVVKPEAPSADETQLLAETEVDGLDTTVRELNVDVEGQLRETVDLWAAAWSEQNVPQYLSNYSKRFAVPDRQSRRSWESLRRSRVTKPSRINISVEYTGFAVVSPDVAEVKFRQTYRSNTYSDTTKKMLRLRKEDEIWRIVYEGAE